MRLFPYLPFVRAMYGDGMCEHEQFVRSILVVSRECSDMFLITNADVTTCREVRRTQSKWISETSGGKGDGEAERGREKLLQKL